MKFYARRHIYFTFIFYVNMGHQMLGMWVNSWGWTVGESNIVLPQSLRQSGHWRVFYLERVHCYLELNDSREIRQISDKTSFLKQLFRPAQGQKHRIPVKLCFNHTIVLINKTIFEIYRQGYLWVIALYNADAVLYVIFMQYLFGIFVILVFTALK